jgi:xylulokinase
MLADMFNTEIVTVNVTQGAAYGAALLAGVGVGCYANVVEACRQVVRVTDRCAPGPAAACYADFYPRYRALYPALAAEFKAITGVVAKHG